MSEPPVSYSDILIDFIQPLLDGQETESSFLEKAKMGMVAWNFQVAEAHNIPFSREFKEIYDFISKTYPEGKAILSSLIKRKSTLYGEYHQFILKVESRKKPAGNTNLYVESVPIDKLTSSFR